MSLTLFDELLLDERGTEKSEGKGRRDEDRGLEKKRGGENKRGEERRENREESRRTE